MKYGVFFLVITVIFANLCVTSNQDPQLIDGNSSTKSLEMEIATSAYWDNFTFIHIKNNWTDAVTWGWCKGDGTWGNPYVLENLTINNEANSSCITIEDSLNVYFVINNCTLNNSAKSGFDAGIELKTVQNGTIMDCYIYKNAYGILMSSSENMTITGNRIQDNSEDGISLKGCNENSIKDNIVKSNDEDGINFEISDNNNVTDLNHIRNNGKYGLRFDSYSDNNLIQDNYIGYNEKGCYINEGSDNDFIDNDCVGDYDDDPEYGDLDEQELSIAGYEIGILCLFIAGFGVILYLKKIRKTIL